MTKEEKAKRERAAMLVKMIEEADTLEEITKIEEELERGGYADVMNKDEEEKAD